MRVLVVDDQRLIRDGIASLLSIRPGIEVVGTAVDGRDAVAETLETEPDVVLMDIRMPKMDGVEAVAFLRDRASECRVVMLTTFDDEEYVVQALQPARTAVSSRICRPRNSPTRSAWRKRASPSSTRPSPAV